MPFNFNQYYHYKSNNLLYPNQPPNYWTSEEQRVAPSNNLGVFKFVGTVAGIGAAGFIPYKGGNLWDKYLSGLKRLEEYSPGGI